MASSLRIGAAWWRVDKNGNHYLSGKVNAPVPLLITPDQPIHLYANPNKQEGDQQPDYELVILPMQERETSPAPPPPPRPAPTQSGRNGGSQQRPAPAPESAGEGGIGDGLDDPFSDDAPPARSQGRPPLGRR